MKENFLRPPHGIGEYTADAVRALGLLSVIVAGVLFEPTDAGVVAFALPALVAPRFIGVRPGLDIVFGVTVLVAAWSNVLDLYRTVAGWDLVVHFACTGALAVMGYLLLARLRTVPPPRAGLRRTAIVITTAVGLAISALWEMVEWFGHTFISDQIFVAYADTIGDMALGGLGSMAAGIVLASVRLERGAVDGRPGPIR